MILQNCEKMKNTETSGVSDAYVLVVDDDASVCWALEQVLRGQNCEVCVVASVTAAKKCIQSSLPSIVFTDIRMPEESGLDLLFFVKENYNHIPVVVMTAYGTLEVAVHVLHDGAFDYLIKPLDMNAILNILQKVKGQVALKMSLAPEEYTDENEGMVGQSSAMQEVYKRIAASATTSIGVLVTGPTGSGKELVARALHNHSQRHEHAFVAINCGALPAHLIEGTLFGHEQGAFTGAHQQRIGCIETADKGTLFLDEVGELSESAQVKLLRFLQDQCFTRVGGRVETAVDVRVIAATNRNLMQSVADGTFREDLYYRLSIIGIELPALKDHIDDLFLLTQHFLKHIARHLHKTLSITQRAFDLMLLHTWPGNVRELKHTLEEAATLSSDGLIDVENMRDLLHIQCAEHTDESFEFMIGNEVRRLLRQDPGSVSRKLLQKIEALMIHEALAFVGGNQSKASELLGLSRITVRKRMQEMKEARGLLG